MADIDTADTFVDGQVVNAARLNNIIDAAVILAAFISAKPDVAPALGDHLIYESAGILKKARVDAVPGVASVNLTSTVPGTTITNTTPSGPAVNIALNQLPGGANTFLASPDGAVGQPVYRKIKGRDMVLPVHTIPAWDIDWTLGTTHYKNINVTGQTFTYNAINPALDGHSIFVELNQGGASNIVHFPSATKWEDGIEPVLSPGAGRIDIIQLWYLGGIVYGKRILKNAF